LSAADSNGLEAPSNPSNRCRGALLVLNAPEPL
jgi:hypothetical protein